MALIALRDIRGIDYLGYGTIFTSAMFLPKKKLEVLFGFFFRQKSPRCSPGGGGGGAPGGWVRNGIKITIRKMRLYKFIRVT
jgi:hypothetical protein